MDVIALVKEGFQSVAEHAASYKFGQTVLRQVDKALWVLEKCARWAVPPPLDPEERPQPELVRPLPWVFFLMMLVTLRVTRESISLVNLVLGKPPLRSADVVTYIQGKRRYLRTLKYQGNRMMRARTGTTREPWYGGLRSLFEFTMCFKRQSVHYGNNNTTRVSNNDEVLVVKRSKRPRQEESPASTSEATMERLIEKMMVDLDADSGEDSSYTLTNATSLKSDRSDTADSDQEPTPSEESAPAKAENEAPTKTSEPQNVTTPADNPSNTENHPNNDTENHPRKDTENNPSKDTDNNPRKDTENHPTKDTENHPRKDTENHPRKDIENYPSKGTENNPRKDTENHPSNDTENHPTKDTENHPIEEANQSQVEDATEEFMLAQNCEDNALKADQPSPKVDSQTFIQNEKLRYQRSPKKNQKLANGRTVKSTSERNLGGERRDAAVARASSADFIARGKKDNYRHTP